MRFLHRLLGHRQKSERESGFVFTYCSCRKTWVKG